MKYFTAESKTLPVDLSPYMLYYNRLSLSRRYQTETIHLKILCILCTQAASLQTVHTVTEVNLLSLVLHWLSLRQEKAHALKMKYG